MTPEMKITHRLFMISEEMRETSPGRAGDLRDAVALLQRLMTERDDLVSIIAGISKQAAAVAKSYTPSEAKEII